MNILLVNSSPRQRRSSTYNLAQAIIQQISSETSVNVTEEDVTILPQVDEDYAVAVCSPELMRSEAKGSLAQSNRLIADLEQADMVIIASPIHNFSLPSGLKSWVDHVVRAGKTFHITPTGKNGIFKKKPVYVLVSSGGSFSGDKAYQPDFFTPYLHEVLKVVGLDNVTFFTLEGTATPIEELQKKVEDTRKKVKDYMAGSCL
ncbi:FMN-dependent NADH-azoreductase [Vibrio alginolyticus]|nr:NAD(P)H-dependent oxidoreductase [Vibrio parahaemolyticus]EJE8516503.1 NAD(P)H-dependent oxidoreductase [Vibrio parahaemolyticus]EJE8775298.1 NAD(P)H-dependent oxidoreductase [Vibrio parahaemolyticus]MBM4891717.1 NAD(P)H-dependent oxidoreductase [Vibrio parahaemolyticus]WMP11148.1 NAD(P)H-dependent oxidoreductase [Vibrio parahaemolyticus]